MTLQEARLSNETAAETKRLAVQTTAVQSTHDTTALQKGGKWERLVRQRCAMSQNATRCVARAFKRKAKRLKKSIRTEAGKHSLAKLGLARR